MIVLDTCVLSEAFKKPEKSSRHGNEIESLKQMVRDDWPIGIPGIVLQEFLTAFKTEKRIEKAKNTLDGFPILLADSEDHLLAARIRIQCIKRGVAAQTVDCLIAATSINRNSRLLTFDKDFTSIAKVCHLKLFEV